MHYKELATNEVVSEKDAFIYAKENKSFRTVRIKKNL